MITKHEELISQSSHFIFILTSPLFSFPKQPPKGKGSQVSEGTGAILASSPAPELSIISEYRQLFQGVASAASLLLSRRESASMENTPRRQKAVPVVPKILSAGGLRSRLQD
jgi:hypothetical protein